MSEQAGDNPLPQRERACPLRGFQQCLGSQCGWWVEKAWEIPAGCAVVVTGIGVDRLAQEIVTGYVMTEVRTEGPIDVTLINGEGEPVHPGGG